MIDAYEIGIQLLLQDDVSAGLAVINRGLAEVDRGIAATSASLAGLVRDADRAAKAVAGATGARPPQPVASESKISTPAGEAASRSADEASPIAVTTAPVDAWAQLGDATPPAPSKAVPAEERGSKQALPAPNVAERVSPTVAPSPPISSDVGLPERRKAGHTASSSDVTPVRTLESAVSSPDTPSRRRERDLPVSAVVRRPDAASNSSLAITATMRPSRAVPSPSPIRSQVGAAIAGQSSAALDRAPAAPGSTSSPLAPQPSSARLIERAAAPQSPSRERAEGGGGAVMLDGRLVGQWLSEHMSREASRPPSGTSFFDARQTPAWNVSGAL